MLEIKINNTALDLDPNTSIQFTNASPVFDADSLDRQFTLPFKVPLTARNKSARKHKNRIDAGNKSASTPAQVRFGGHLLMDGKMIQTAASDIIEEVSIINEPLKAREKLKTIKINEILESFNLLDGRPAPVWSFGMDVNGDYELDVDGIAATGTVTAPINIPTVGNDIVDQLNTAFPGIASFNFTTNSVELDSFIVQTHPIGSWNLFTLDSYENVALYRYHAVRDHVLATNATPIESHCFPVLMWFDFYGENNAVFWGAEYWYPIFNNVIDGVFLENIDMDPEKLNWQNSVIPCPRVPYILQKIADELGGYIWAGDVWNDPDFQKLILVPNLALDEVTSDVYEDLQVHKRNTLKPEIILNSLVPSITGIDFINYIANTFSLYLEVSDGVLTFHKKQACILVPPINLNNKIGKAYATEPNTISGWKILMTPNSSEKYTAAGQLLPVTTGEGEYKLYTTNTMYADDEAIIQHVTGHTAKVPHTKQPGRSPALESGANKSTMPLCMLFCHELQTDSLGDEYIFASHDGLNYDGDTVGAYSLSPEGEFGLYEIWHKHVIEYANSDVLNVTGYLHAGDVQKLLQWKSGRIQFYHPEGGNVIAAIKSIQVGANSSGLLPTRLELLYQ